MKQKNFLKIILINFLFFSINGYSQIISQYIEANSGTTPKGIEIWNNTASTLDFSTNNLVIEKGANGAAPSTDATISSGYLLPGEVMVIGTSDMGTYLSGQGLGGVFYFEKSFTFNGDDALVVKYNGVTTDAFGDPGSDPGSSWSGSGVNTRNQNIRLLTSITTGDTDGWTDPSTRFETVSSSPSTLPAGLSGFGIPPNHSVWTGATDNDWTDSNNWNSDGVPTGSTSFVLPSGLTNYPTTSSAVSVVSGIIYSGATLVTGDTFSGNVTYKRNLANGSQWYLMSSPVVGEMYNDAWNTANSIDEGQGSNRGVSWYDNSTNDGTTGHWRYLQATNSGSFNVGQGYSVRLSTGGDVSFTGTGLYTSNQPFTLTKGVNDFNLIGNPFTGFVTLGTFESTNGSVIEDEYYFWTGSAYVTRNNNNDSAFEIAPGQAFFVEATTASAVTFEVSDVEHGTDTFNTKSTNIKSEIHLSVIEGTRTIPVRILYTDGTTKGFDAGYDGKLFGGASSDFMAYSDLVQSNGIKYQTQVLPNQDHETMVIPIGLKAAANKEITFIAEALNIPNGLHVYLEDRQTGDVTKLDETNSNYKVTLNTALNGSGRFYLHTRSSALSTDDIALEGVSVYAVNKNTLRISGVNSTEASVKIYTILGKKVVDTSFSSKGVYEAKLPNLTTGVYIVQLATEKGNLSKKIVLE